MFLGSTTDEQIREMYDKIVGDYGISEKITFVLSDSAANIRTAFNTRFPPPGPSDKEFGTYVENKMEPMWNNLKAPADALFIHNEQRLNCFAHSLQLVIHDGIRDVSSLGAALETVSRLSSLLHSSTSFKVSIMN